jgi:hypothetical protein
MSIGHNAVQKTTQYNQLRQNNQRLWMPRDASLAEGKSVTALPSFCKPTNLDEAGQPLAQTHTAERQQYIFIYTHGGPVPFGQSNCTVELASSQRTLQVGRYSQHSLFKSSATVLFIVREGFPRLSRCCWWLVSSSDLAGFRKAPSRWKVLEQSNQGQPASCNIHTRRQMSKKLSVSVSTFIEFSDRCGSTSL